MIPADRLSIAPEVADALRDGTPVVALESTLISHGLPYPQNVEVATGSEAAVRASGAVPATVALHEGRLLVGLDADQLEALAPRRAAPCSRSRDRTSALPSRRAAGAPRTVAATMIAAQAVGIRVFATGGIGGVHIGAIDGDRPSFDISADLDELARTRVAVVCAGPKAILDVPRTLEYLETRGVPVVVHRDRRVPRSTAGAPGSRPRRTSPTSPGRRQWSGRTRRWA